LSGLVMSHLSHKVVARNMYSMAFANRAKVGWSLFCMEILRHLLEG
jgi:hypothetical protein